MVSLLCPLCNEPITGSGEFELSRNLKLHFINRHAVSMYPTPEGSNVRPDDHYTEPYDLRTVEYHHPAPERLSGEALPESVICPICGDAVRGLTSDKLSYNLAYHMDAAHGLKVKFSGKA